MDFYQIDGKLSEKEIKEYIEKFKDEMLPGIQDREDYFNGDNPYIRDRTTGDNSANAPDWRVRVSYARKIINTVAGYMYRPGDIKYNYVKDSYREKIEYLFTLNKEIIKTSQAGKAASTQGFCYELFMADENQNPIWIVADPREIIPFYTNELNSKLFAFIRFIEVMEGQQTITYADVYYADVIEHWKTEKNALVKYEEDTINIYANSGMPPLNIIKNNEEMIGDFACCTWDGKNAGLIDAYDVLTSDGINEEDRFAWAYLLMSADLSQKDAEKVKRIRAFTQLGQDGYVKFLTRDIPTDFFQFMQEWIKKEIHKQTHIPDFLDMSIGQEMSGVALDRLLYDLEFICATKETYFKEGLYNRLKFIDSIINVTDAEFIDSDIEILMQRNKPSDNMLNAQIASQYKQSGLPITDKTLVERFAPFVKDVDEEIAEYEKQQEAQLEQYMLQEEQFSTEENTDTEEE